MLCYSLCVGLSLRKWNKSTQQTCLSRYSVPCRLLTSWQVSAVLYLGFWLFGQNPEMHFCFLFRPYLFGGRIFSAYSFSVRLSIMLISMRRWIWLNNWSNNLRLKWLYSRIWITLVYNGDISVTISDISWEMKFSHASNNKITPIITWRVMALKGSCRDKPRMPRFQRRVYGKLPLSPIGCITVKLPHNSHEAWGNRLAYAKENKPLKLKQSQRMGQVDEFTLTYAKVIRYDVWRIKHLQTSSSHIVICKSLCGAEMVCGSCLFYT